MMEMVNAISVRLNEIFGDEYTVYLEQVEQGLQTPCFFIQPLDASDKNMIDNRKYRTSGFAIVFIPSDKKGHREQFVEVADKLFDNFDSFELSDGVVLSTFDRNINILDDVLHFTVLFKYYKYAEKAAEDMQESLEIR